MVLSVSVMNQMQLPKEQTANPGESGAQSAPVKLYRSSSIPFAIQVKQHANC